MTYHGNTFVLPMPEDWRGTTVYTFAGPFHDDVQHTLTVNVDDAVVVEALLDYADWQIRELKTKLNGYRLLKKDAVRLNNGLPAYRAVSVWYPTEDLRLYLHHLYVLYQQIGYIITATFTKKTRQTLGLKTEHMMLGFEPFR